jgi:hypothetical protein
MSDQPLAHRPSDAALRKIEDNPFSVLPPEWAAAAGFFAATKSALLRSPASLCVNLKYWISKGLTLDDAKAIFRRLCDPDIARGHNFENQLMADLAGAVADALRRRKVLAEMKRRREAEADPTNDAAGVVRLADVFRCPDPPAGGLGAKHS